MTDLSSFDASPTSILLSEVPFLPKARARHPNTHARTHDSESLGPLESCPHVVAKPPVLCIMLAGICPFISKDQRTGEEGLYTLCIVYL